MRIGLLQCDYVPDRYRSIAGNYHDMIEAMLGNRPADVVVFDARGGELPEHPPLYEDQRERLGDLVGPAIESLTTTIDADVVTDWMYAMFASATVADS